MELNHLVETAKGMFHSRKGQLGGVGAGKAIFITLVVASIIAMVGLLVFSQVESSIDRGGFTTAQNTTYDNIVSTTLDAYDLAIVGLIVLAAVFILGIVFLLG